MDLNLEVLVSCLEHSFFKESGHIHRSRIVVAQHTRACAGKMRETQTLPGFANWTHCTQLPAQPTTNEPTMEWNGGKEPKNQRRTMEKETQEAQTEHAHVLL